MGELYEVDQLTCALQDARRRTLAIYEHLDLDRLEVPYMAIVNPPRWELAHVAWFQEFWCLRYETTDPAGRQTPSILPTADALFDSRTVPHADRWTLPVPSAAEVFRYLDRSLDRTLEALARTSEKERYFFELALLHEDMHGEALMMTLQTLELPAPPLGQRDPPASRMEPPREVIFDGGEFLQGSLPDSGGFVFDNEKWAHVAAVRPFALAKTPVTHGDVAAFCEEGGYRRPELWTAEGWRWRQANAVDRPHAWRRDGPAWFVRRFDRWHPLDLAAPMMHVSLHEALAYCRWAGRRLPTEAEWEFAARNGGAGDRFPWGDATAEPPDALDCRFAGPSLALEEPHPVRSGLRQMLGGVWEWTSSPFRPYPGFAPDPYREYSEPWFATHFVLRGGSFATRSRLVHNRFRNFYVPDRRDVFAGFRTCAIDAR